MQVDVEKLDKFQRLVWDAQLPVTILGNPATAEFELVSCKPGPLPDGLERRIKERGLYFLGNVGLVDGVPRSALDEPLDNASLDAISAAYLAHVEHSLNSSLEIDFLQRLHALQDDRLS